MKKLLIICILIITIVFISGCTSDEKSTVFQTTNPNNELNTLEPFIDPKLKNIKIEKSDPDIEVVRVELVDMRDYAESENWRPHLLLSNNGNQPVYIAASIKYINNGPIWHAPFRSNILNSGERMWINLSSGGETYDKQHTLDKVSAFVITTSKTVTPNISPEFKNLNYFSFERTKTSGSSKYPAAPFIDLHSIKYEITDDGNGWKSLLIEVSSDNNGGSVSFIIMGSKRKALYHADHQPLRGGILIYPGKTEIVKIPLRKFTADDIYGIQIRASPLPFA